MGDMGAGIELKHQSGAEQIPRVAKLVQPLLLRCFRKRFEFAGERIIVSAMSLNDIDASGNTNYNITVKFFCWRSFNINKKYNLLVKKNLKWRKKVDVIFEIYY
jgi:hypothetical protein